jgi:guanosine-3',5'-bis(diphosphate) 3'-pyrophosphohydrolase
MNDVKPVAPDKAPKRRPASLVLPPDSSTNSHARFDDIAAIFAALHFAADKHRDQRRKGECASPYINHPIEVAELLVRVGGVTNSTLLQAAILHDTVEDTETTLQELEERFGPGVRHLVEELSDDKSLPKEERKRLQIEHASSLSEGARQIKLADKICNVRDITSKPPRDWSLERQIGYLEWSEQVVAGCRGVNERLEQAFRDALAEARKHCRNEG